jgi:hypothetical protein
VPGDVVNFSGAGNDPEDGNLPATSLHWTLVLHHNDHVHPLIDQTGASGSFTVEDHAEIGTFYYELDLTATDSQGVTGTTSVKINVVAPPPPPPDYAVAINPSSATLKAGASADLVLSLKPNDTFRDSVNLTCVSPANVGIGCTIDHSSVNLANGSATAKVTISTTAPSAALYHPHLPGIPWSLPVAAVVFCSSIGARRKMRKHYLALLLLLAFATLLVSCGGTKDKPPTNTGTPPGNYTLTIKAVSGSIEHDAAVNLTVN